MNISIDESSYLLGYSKRKTFMNIHIPFLRNSLLFIIILISLEIIRELPITLILRPFNFETFATTAYISASEDLLEAAAVPSLFLILIASLFIIVTSKYILEINMNKNFFEINNVDFKISGKVKVKNVSFSIENEGDIICLLGPSGIGKTTILRTIAGLEKIKKGSIELNGKTLSSEKINIEPEDRNISLAFQDNSLFPHYTIEKNILLGAERNKEKKNKN